MSLTPKEVSYIADRWEGKFEHLNIDGSGDSVVVEASGPLRQHNKGQCDHSDQRKIRASNIQAGIRKDGGREYLCLPQEEGNFLFTFKWAKFCQGCDALLDYEIDQK